MTSDLSSSSLNPNRLSDPGSNSSNSSVEQNRKPTSGQGGETYRNPSVNITLDMRANSMLSEEQQSTLNPENSLTTQKNQNLSHESLNRSSTPFKQNPLHAVVNINIALCKVPPCSRPTTGSVTVTPSPR